jgi:hypothetical protein
VAAIALWAWWRGFRSSCWRRSRAANDSGLSARGAYTVIAVGGQARAVRCWCQVALATENRRLRRWRGRRPAERSWMLPAVRDRVAAEQGSPRVALLLASAWLGVPGFGDVGGGKTRDWAEPRMIPGCPPGERTLSSLWADRPARFVVGARWRWPFAQGPARNELDVSVAEAYRAKRGGVARRSAGDRSTGQCSGYFGTGP